MALVVVFLFVTALYILRAAEVQPFSLHARQASTYNLLADAFLHFHLWVAHIPASTLGPNPYNPATRPAFLSEAFWDAALYHGYIYSTWGPTPALVLVPLHLLGYQPSESLIITPFVIAGLAFALATLRVILRQIGDISPLICMLAALVLACASVVPCLMQYQSVYFEAVAGGYCFAMAGIWLAVAARVEGRVSPMRLGLASLCFGIAVGSRPTLALAALALVPVALALRPIRRHRGQLAALTLPFGACLVLLAAYNDARFGNPLEIGTNYQLNSIYHAHWGQLSYMPPGLWSYLIAPPRLEVLFPFLSIVGTKVSYPLSFSAQYAAHAEPTGGLLAMTPIAVFLVGVPWIWRRRPALLGPLGLPLLLMASAGVAIIVFLTFYFFGTSERYEVDYTTLLLFGALAVWLVLSTKARGWHRRLARIGGGLLAVWSCASGLAIAYQATNSGTGPPRALMNLSSPLSTTIATVAGHAVLAEVSATNVVTSSESYDNLGASVTGFWLDTGEHVDLTIVSPDSRRVALAGGISAGPRLRRGAVLEAQVRGPGRSIHRYRLPTAGNEVLLPVDVTQGINRFTLRALPAATNAVDPSDPASRVVMIVLGLHLAHN